MGNIISRCFVSKVSCAAARVLTCVGVLAANRVDFQPDAIDARYARGETAVVTLTAFDHHPIVADFTLR